MANVVDGADRLPTLFLVEPRSAGVEFVDDPWLADEFSRGTWAIHRPGWYEHHHAGMRRDEPGLMFAGSDLADGWAGFIDDAIESGLRAGRRAADGAASS